MFNIYDLSFFVRIIDYEDDPDLMTKTFQEGEYDGGPSMR